MINFVPAGFLFFTTWTFLHEKQNHTINESRDSSEKNEWSTSIFSCMISPQMNISWTEYNDAQSVLVYFSHKFSTDFEILLQFCSHCSQQANDTSFSQRSAPYVRIQLPTSYNFYIADILHTLPNESAKEALWDPILKMKLRSRPSFWVYVCYWAFRMCPLKKFELDLLRNASNSVPSFK